MKLAKDMTDDELGIMVAELCGWSHTTSGNVTYWWHEELNKTLPLEDDGFRSRPRYESDLNVMHEAEGTMNPGQAVAYRDFIAGKNGLALGWEWGFASARQRAEAFVETMRKAKE